VTKDAPQAKQHVIIVKTTPNVIELTNKLKMKHTDAFVQMGIMGNTARRTAILGAMVELAVSTIRMADLTSDALNVHRATAVNIANVHRATAVNIANICSAVTAHKMLEHATIRITVVLIDAAAYIIQPSIAIVLQVLKHVINVIIMEP